MEELRAWWEVPSIAHFCSLFAAAFDLTEFHIDELEDGLLASDTEDGAFLVTDLMCQLLCGCYQRNDITPYNWELYLKDIIKHRWQVETGLPNPLENSSFADLSLRTKVEIIHTLCNYRLDADDVTEVLRGLDGDPLRVEPLGKDRNGATYWYFYGTRLYREDPNPESESEQQSDEDEEPKEEIPQKKNGNAKRKKERDKKSESRGRGQRGRRGRGRGRGGGRGGKRSRKQDSESEEQSSDDESQSKDNAPSSDSNNSDAAISYVKRGGASRRRGRGMRGSRGQGRGRGGRSPRGAKSKKICSESSDDSDKSSESDADDNLPLKKRPRRKSGKKAGKASKKVDEEEGEDTEDYEDKVSEDPSSEDLPLKDLNDKLKHEKLDSIIKEEQITIKEEAKDEKENLSMKSSDLLEKETKLDIDTKIETNKIDKKKVDSNQDAESGLRNIKEETKPDEECSSKNPDPTSPAEVKVESGSQEIKEEKDIKTETDQESKLDAKDEKKSDDATPKQEETKDDLDTKESISKTNDESDKSASSDEMVILEGTSDKDPMSVTSDKPSDTEMLSKAGTSSSDDEVLSVVKKRVHEQNREVPAPETQTPGLKTPDFVPPFSGRWHVECNTMEDWENFAERFEKSRIKSEKLLHKALRDDFLPDLPDIYVQQEKDRERRIEEMAPRRASGRVKKLKAEEEQLILDSLEHDREHKRARQTEETEMRRRMDEMEQEEIDKQRQIEKERAAAERARRAQLREERAQMLAEGREIPPELLNGRILHRKQSHGSKSPVRMNEDMEASMYKVFDAIYEHPDSWPFHEPVDESYAPGYFDIIQHPMDMATIERKLNDKVYATREAFIEDFTLMFDNCHAYNGADSEYTKMAGILEKKFQKAVRRHLPRKEEDSDASDVEFNAKMAREASFNLNSTPRNRQPSRAASSRAKAAIQVAAEEMKLSNTETSEEDAGSLSSASNQDGSLMRRVRGMKSASNSPQPQKSMLAKAPHPVAYNNGEVCITRVRNPGTGNPQFPPGQGPMGPHPQMRHQMMGHPQQMMNQQGYMNQQRPPGYMGQQYPNPQGQFPQGQQGQFPRQQGPYPGQGPYPNQQGGYPPQQGQYPGQQGQRYPGQPGPYPGQQGQYPGPQGNYPGQHPGQYMGPQGQYGQYPRQMGPYPNQMGPQNRPMGPGPGVPQQYINGQPGHVQQLGPDGRPVVPGDMSKGPQQFPTGPDGAPRPQIGPQGRPMAPGQMPQGPQQQQGPVGQEAGQHSQGPHPYPRGPVPAQIGPDGRPMYPGHMGPQGPQQYPMGFRGPGGQMGPQQYPMGPRGPNQIPRPMMGPRGPIDAPGQQMGPQEHSNVPGQQMGPRGPSNPGENVRPQEPTDGSGQPVAARVPSDVSGQQMGPGGNADASGQQMGPRGPIDGSGQMMGPRGPIDGPGQMMGPRGPIDGPGQMMGPRGPVDGPGQTMGPRGPVDGPGQMMGPRGPIDGPGQMMGPRGPVNGPGQMMGPRGPIDGPGQMMGPRGPVDSSGRMMGPGGPVEGSGQQIGPRASIGSPAQQMGPRAPNIGPSQMMGPRGPILPHGPQGPYGQQGQDRPYHPMNHPQQWGPQPDGRHGMPYNYRPQDSQAVQQHEGEQKGQNKPEGPQAPRPNGPEGSSQTQSEHSRPQGHDASYPQHPYGPRPGYPMPQGPQQPSMPPGMNTMDPRHPMGPSNMTGYPGNQYGPRYGNLPPGNAPFQRPPGPEAMSSSSPMKATQQGPGQNTSDPSSTVPVSGEKGDTNNQTGVQASPAKNSEGKSTAGQNTEILPHLYSSNQPGSFRQSFWRAKTTVTTVKPGLQLAVPAICPSSKQNPDDENSRESIEDISQDESSDKGEKTDIKDSEKEPERETSESEDKKNPENMFESNFPPAGNRENQAPTCVTMTRLSHGQIPSGYPQRYQPPSGPYPPGQHPPGQYGGAQQGPCGEAQYPQGPRPRMSYPGMHTGMPQMLPRHQQQGMQAQGSMDPYQKAYPRPPGSRPEMQGIASHPFLGALSRMEPKSQFEPKGPNDTYVPKLDDLHKYDPVPAKKSNKGKKKSYEDREGSASYHGDSDREDDDDADSLKQESEVRESGPEKAAKIKDKETEPTDGDLGPLEKKPGSSDSQEQPIPQAQRLPSQMPVPASHPQGIPGHGGPRGQIPYAQSPYGPNVYGQGQRPPMAFGQQNPGQYPQGMHGPRPMPGAPNEVYSHGPQGMRQPNPDSLRQMQGQHRPGPVEAGPPFPGQGQPGTQQGLGAYGHGQPGPGPNGPGPHAFGPNRYPVNGPQGMGPQLQGQNPAGQYGQAGQPYQQRYGYPGGRFMPPESMQRPPHGPAGPAMTPEGPRFSGFDGRQLPGPQSNMMRLPVPGQQEEMPAGQVNTQNIPDDKAIPKHGVGEQSEKQSESESDHEPHAAAEMDNVESESHKNKDVDEISQEKFDNQNEDVNIKGDPDEKSGASSDLAKEGEDNEEKAVKSEEYDRTSKDQIEELSGGDGNIAKVNEADASLPSDSKKDEFLERSKEETAVKRPTDESVPTENPSVSGPGIEHLIPGRPGNAMPHYSAPGAIPGQVHSNMPVGNHMPNYPAGGPIQNNGPMPSGPMYPQMQQQGGFLQQAPGPGVGRGEGVSPWYNVPRPQYGGPPSAPVHPQQAPASQPEQAPSPMRMERQRHPSRPEMDAENEPRLEENKGAPPAALSQPPVLEPRGGRSREPSPRTVIERQGLQTDSPPVPSPSSIPPPAKKRKQESPDPMKAKIWRPGVEESSLKPEENEAVPRRESPLARQQVDDVKVPANINGTPEVGGDNIRTRPMGYNIGIASDVPMSNVPGQSSEMVALSPSSHASSSTSYPSSLHPTKESIQAISPSPPSSPKQFLDLDQQRPNFPSNTSYSNMPRPSLSVMPGYNPHMPSQPPSGNLLDLDRYRARLPSQAAVHRPRPDSPQQRYLDMEMARSEMARSEMARSEMARSEMARSEMARSEMARSEMARSEMARSEMARSEMARSEMARSGHMMAGYGQSHMMKHPGAGMSQAGMMSHYPGGGYPHPGLQPRPAMSRDPAMMIPNPQTQLQLQHEQQMRHEAQIRQEQQREQQMRHEHMLRQQMLQQRQHPSIRPQVQYTTEAALSASKMLTGLVAAHQNQSPYSQQPSMPNGAGNLSYPNGAANMPYGVPRGPFQ